MKPIISPWMIYFAGICDPIKTLFGVVAFALCIISISLLGFISLEYLSEDEECKYLRYIKKTITTFILCVALAIAIPSQKTIYTIAIANQITIDNINLIGGTAKDVIEYLTDQIVKITDNKNTKEK